MQCKVQGAFGTEVTQRLAWLMRVRSSLCWISFSVRY